MELHKEKSEHIEISFSFEGEEIEVLLYRESDGLQDLIARNQNKNEITVQYGVYYKGIIKGDYQSLAAVSFFENDIIGVISSASKNGNIGIAKTADGDFMASNNLSVKGKQHGD